MNKLLIGTSLGAIAACSAVSAPAYAQAAQKPTAATGASATAAAAATTAQPTAPSATPNLLPGDIIITATRRDERLNRVPIAVQALTGQALQQLNVSNFDKLVQYLPNVRAANRGPGVSTVFIRGLSSDTSGIEANGVAGVQPNVALYLNDLPASSPGRNLDIHATDLQRVEVLAGPQGTLFGASAMGGAVRYITNKPDLHSFDAEFTGTASTTKHGTGSYSGEGFVNIPVIQDKLGVRIVGYNDYQGGYIDNVGASFQMPFDPGGPGVLPSGNPTLVAQAIQSCAGVANCVATAAGTTGGWIAPTRLVGFNSAAVRQHFNDANYAGGRVEATWQVNPDWSVELLGMHQTLKTDGVFSYDPSLGDLKTAEMSSPSLRDTIDAGTATLHGRLGFLDAILTASFLDHRAVQHGDYSRYDNIGSYIAYYQCDRGVYYSGYANSYKQGNTCYAPNSPFIVNDDNKRWTEEFRVTTPADQPLRATLGVFHDVNRLYDLTDWLYSNPQAGFIYPVAPSSTVNVLGTGTLPVGSGFVNTILRTDKQIAAYGEVSYDITKQLTITGGTRYYSETAGLFGGSSGSFATGVRAPCTPAPGTGTSPAAPAVCIYTPAANPPTQLGASSVLATRLAGIDPKTYKGFIFKGNINYKINENSIVYATYSEGYRPGGFNRRGCVTAGVARFGQAVCDANRAYAPDKAYNYEIGTKLGLFDHQAQINLAAYIIDWKNILMSVYDSNVSNQTFINNLGNGRIHGIEGQVTLRPRSIRGLTIDGAFSYNDSKFLGATKNPIAQLLSSSGVLVPAGSPLALSPKFQGNLRVREDWETSNGLKLFVSGGVHHVGKSISSDVANTNVLYAGCGSYSPYPSCSGVPSTINGVTVTKGTPIVPVPVSFPLAAYTTFEASMGVSRDNWSLEFFGENLTDKRPQLFKQANDGVLRLTTSRPRTFGMRFSVKM
ncbi:MAG TPA: TonB-dependent receptor [Sphingomicrobium sp.]|nr:TonB-dependent receptor [Sphingomicrobium sp.]